MGDRYRYSRPRSPTLYNPGRTSLPIDVYRDYPPSPVRGDRVHSIPRREVIPGPRSSGSSIAGAPVTTTTYKISADPLTRTSSLREGGHSRRSTLDGATTQPAVPTIITNSHLYKPRERPVVHSSTARPTSPLQDPYRSSQEDYYAIPASSGRGQHHRTKRYSNTTDHADMYRMSSDRDPAHHLRVAPPRHSYARSRPVYPSPVARDTGDYGDEGYGYTNPREMVQWDLNNTVVPRRHSRNRSYDQGRPTSLTGYSDITPSRAINNRPPVSTRGFDRIPQLARATHSGSYDRDRDRERLESRMIAPAPTEPVRPVSSLDRPRMSDSTSHRPAVYYNEHERRGSGRDDYYEVRDNEPRYRRERHRNERRSDMVEQRDTGRLERGEEATRFERIERGDQMRVEPRQERERREDNYKDFKRHGDEIKDRKRPDDDYNDPKDPKDPKESKESKDPKDPKDQKDKDHKGRDAAVAGLSLASAALGVKAFKDSGDDHAERRRDYDDEPRRRRDPRDDKDAVERSREPTERRHREDSPIRGRKDRSPPPPVEIVEPTSRGPRERRESRGTRDSDAEPRHRLEGPLSGSAIETESSVSDETQQRRVRPRRESGPAFNPRNTMDLKALKEALNKEPASATQSTPPKPRAESVPKDSQALTEIRSDLQSNSQHPRILTAAATTDNRTPVKSILRAPREKFPEDPAPIREGVAPLKDAKKDGVPTTARWTRISRKLVNPEALELGKERYEAREDFVIVLRVLSRDEVQTYAEVTERIRTAREEAEEEEERRARRRARREQYERHKRERISSGAEPRRSSSNSHRSYTRDKEFHSGSDTTSDSYPDRGDKGKDYHIRDRDRGKTKAIESGAVMSGGLQNIDDIKQRGDEKKMSLGKADLAMSS